MFKSHYQRFCSQHAGELHFTAHSHQFWPDVTRDAMLQCWDDAARYVDGKWEHLFRELIPETRGLIAKIIGSNSPEQIVFAPSSHEFVCRLLSCFEPGKPLAVLTTDSEFHSFRRQLTRFAEYPWTRVRQVAAEPLSSFEERFLAALMEQPYQLVFLSQVFYNSGLALQNLSDFMIQVIRQAPEDTVIVLDAYHGFCAVPTEIGPFADRIFYLAGGYKYAQAGEGVCFLHVPPGCQLRPANTGWFAELGSLAESVPARIAYPDDGQRFAGATFDPCGIYRLRAVLRLFEQLGLDTHAIHRHVEGLQQHFARRLKHLNHPVVDEDKLLFEPGRLHGHFLTFQSASVEAASAAVRELSARSVHVDHRGSRLRFGFGIYHDSNDIDELFKRLDQPINPIGKP